MSQQDMWEIEQSHFDRGVQLICGVDEAGRGPLAGPVCAAAVILPPNVEIPGLNDSKKLSDKKRRELYPVIMEKAIAFSLITGISSRRRLSVSFLLSSSPGISR